MWASLPRSQVRESVCLETAMKPVWLGADQEPAAVARSPKGHPWDYEFNEIRESEQREKGSGRLEGSWEMLRPSQRPTAFVWYPVLMLETVPRSAALASGVAWEPVEAEG